MYRALQLQDIYAPGEKDTFLGVMLLRFKESQIRVIEKIQNREERFRALRNLPSKNPGKVTFWLPVAAFLLEVSIGITAWLIFKWSLF